MPNIDGYELARALRAREPALEGTVLIALTGYGQDSDRRAAKEAGFDHHLVKPIDLEFLVSLITQGPPVRGRSVPSIDERHDLSSMAR